MECAPDKYNMCHPDTETPAMADNCQTYRESCHPESVHTKYQVDHVAPPEHDIPNEIKNKPENEHGINIGLIIWISLLGLGMFALIIAAMTRKDQIAKRARYDR